MSFTGYRTFQKIVETGSLAATARELHISPSAVSKQLSGLEQRLGAKLLQRSTRSIQVTEVGERFFRRCTDVLLAADAAESEVRDLTGKLGGDLKVTLPRAVASREFTLLLRSFSGAYPGITLDISVRNDTQHLIEKKIDVAFRAGHLKDSRLVAIELFRTPIVMCAAPDYIQQMGIPADTVALASHRLLVPSSHYLQAQTERSHASALPSPFENHLLCDDLGMLVELAKSGAGVAMLWESYVRTEIAQGNLVQFDSLIKHAPRPVNMIYLSRDYTPRRLTLFLEHVRNHFGKGMG